MVPDAATSLFRIRRALALVGVLLALAGLVRAQSCPGGDVIAVLHSPSPVRVLDLLDELDVVPFTDVLSLKLLDPATFQALDSVGISGEGTSLTLAPPGPSTAGKSSIFVLTNVGRMNGYQAQGQTLFCPCGTANLIGSCSQYSIRTPPLVHRREQATDAFRSYFARDVVYVGTQNSSSCPDHHYSNSVLALDTNAQLGFRLGEFMPGDLDLVYGLALDPLADLLFVATETIPGTQPSLWAIDASNFWPIPVWSALVGRLWTAPVLRSNRLYTAGLNSGLRAFDPASGSPLWTLPTPYPLVGTLVAPSVPPFHDRLFVRDFLGTVYCARDMGSSAVVEWSRSVPIQTTILTESVLVVDPVAGAVYVGGDDGRIHQLDALTGAEENVIVLDPVPSMVDTMILDVPIEDGERTTLLAGTTAGTLARVCAKDGRVLRNSLDGPASRTSGASGFASYLDTDTGEVGAWVQQLDTRSRVRLTRFEAVAAGPGPCDLGRGPTPCLEQMEYFLVGWPDSGPLGDLADPVAPEKLFHANVTDRLTLVRGYGSSRFGGGDLRETSLLSFDLQGLDLRLPPQGRVALVGKGSGTQLGQLVIPYLDTAAETDTYVAPGSDLLLPEPQAAVRIRGEPGFRLRLR